MSDTQAPDDPEFVDPDDLSVSRDGDGELIGEVRDCGEMGKVEVLPMSYGDIEDEFGGGVSSDIGPEEMANLFNEFYVRPDFDLDAAGVRDLKPLVPRDLLLTLMETSGIDAAVEVDGEGGATVDVSGNA